MSRIETLDRLGEIVIDGAITRKLDFLGTITIGGRHYFNVFRRYNSPYEIVVEDACGDFHCQRDHTVRESVKRILCITDEAIHGAYAEDTIAFKNQAPIYENVMDMRWSEIQGRYAGIALRMDGVAWDMPSELPAPLPPLDSDWATLQWETFSDAVCGDAPITWAPIKQKKEQTHMVQPVTACNLSDRFTQHVTRTASAASPTSPTSSSRTSMENFPEEFTILRNGTKIPKNRR